MSAMLSAVRRRNDVVELTMVTIYIVLTAYLIACHCPPRIAFVLRDAVAPFQIKARARKAEAERSATVWRSPQFETSESASPIFVVRCRLSPASTLGSLVLN